MRQVKGAAGRAGSCANHHPVDGSTGADAIDEARVPVDKRYRVMRRADGHRHADPCGDGENLEPFGKQMLVHQKAFSGNCKLARGMCFHLTPGHRKPVWYASRDFFAPRLAAIQPRASEEYRRTHS